MRSPAVVDGPTRRDSLEISDLLVLWQHPVTREIVPIGRFTRDRQGFGFSYTRAAEDVQGFRPLPGLANLHARYEDTQIPAVFNQRVMSPDRPDYGEYIQTLGLADGLATPWEQIVESGGDRAGDTLQFMPVPAVIDGRARARFLANGFSHIPDTPRHFAGRTVDVTREAQEAALGGLHVGDRVLLEPELYNPEDPNAILLTVNGIPLGWVPRALSASLRPLVESQNCFATVHRRGLPGTPYHLRLAVDLDTPVPLGFRFDTDGRWEPLAG